MKVLFVAEAVTLAHVARLMEVVRASESLEIERYLAFDPRYDRLLGNLGYERLPITTMSSKLFSDRVDHGRVPIDLAYLASSVLEDRKIIQQVKPDLVVGDFRLSLRVSCKLEKIPYAAIINSYWHSDADVSFFAPEHLIARIFPESIARSLFRPIEKTVLNQLGLPLPRLQKRYGLESDSSNLRTYYTAADYLLAAEPEGLISFRQGRTPENLHWIGSFLWSSPGEIPSELNQATRDQTAFITLGSSGPHSITSVLIQTLRKLNFRVVVALGGREPPSDWVDKPQVFFAPSIPNRPMMEKADLIICNGGNPSTHMALSLGKSFFGVPANTDQIFNISSLEKFRVCEWIRGSKIESSTKELEAKLRRLTANQSYRDQARKVQSLISKMPMREAVPHVLRKILSL